MVLDIRIQRQEGAGQTTRARVLLSGRAQEGARFADLAHVCAIFSEPPQGPQTWNLLTMAAFPS